jgi:hypothetical protein
MQTVRTQRDFTEICGDGPKHIKQIKWAGRLCKERCLYNQDPFKSAEMIYTPHTDIYLVQSFGQAKSTKQLCVKYKDRPYCRLKNIR